MTMSGSAVVRHARDEHEPHVAILQRTQDVLVEEGHQGVMGIIRPGTALRSAAAKVARVGAGSRG